MGSKYATTVAAALSVVCIAVGMYTAFAIAPTAVIDLDGGGFQKDLSQKIFYLHVPIAFAAYLGFFVGAWNAVLYLLGRETAFDIRSYSGIHVGMVFGTLVLVTGSIWAKAAWGVWWQWGDRQLLVFLVLFLYYASYFMVRFSIDAGSMRERVSALFAVMGVALVPFSFLAIRLADTLIHPVVIERSGLKMSDSMAIAFILCIVGFLALCILMIQIEVTVKTLAAANRDARRAAKEPADGELVNG